MAEEKELERAFSNLTITPKENQDKIKCLENGRKYKWCCSCLKVSERMTPECGFKSEIVSCVEANIYINGKKHNIKAVDGYYSDIEICLMYGKTYDGKDRSHWGLICQQQGEWKMNYGSEKCILFHHMGDGIEIAIGCLGCCRKRVMNVYGISKPNLICFDFGRSSAAVGRFLDKTSLGRNVGYKYNSKYRKGQVYYEWTTTNCCRLVFDLLFYLKLPYSTAVKFTKTFTGHEGWDEVFKTIVEDHPQFTTDIAKFWLSIKSNPDLKKVEKLIDGQYKLDEALEKYMAKLLENCLIL